MAKSAREDFLSGGGGILDDGEDLSFTVASKKGEDDELVSTSSSELGKRYTSPLSTINPCILTPLSKWSS